MSAKSWYEIRNVAESSAEIFLYDEIGMWGVAASDFIRDLRGLSGKAVTVRVHSPGGSVLDGHAIYNALLRHSGGVTIQVDGLAASMASVIAMVGKPVRMAENAFLMIHNPSGGVFGGSEEMRKQADLIDKMRDGLVNIYAQKSGKGAEEIEKLMDAETWFTAQEAKDFGLIDEVTDKLDVAASFDLSRFKNAPRVDTPKESVMSVPSPEFTAVLNERDLARSQAQENNAKYLAVVAERDALQVNFSAQAEEITNLNSRLTQAEQDFQAYKDAEPERFNAEVVREIAARGHAPVAIPVDGKGKSPQALTSAEFNALHSTDKAAFIRNGGMVSNPE